jgi:hypothetical protein
MQSTQRNHKLPLCGLGSPSQLCVEKCQPSLLSRACRFETRPISRLLLFLPSAFLCLLFASCGSNLPQTIRVSGQVTFDGQPPPAAGSVLFLPIESAAGFPSRPASGAFGTDGQFQAQTFEPGDGLMPGKYLISVECWDMPPSMQGNPGKSHVPKKYQSPQNSGFKLDITRETKPQEIKLEVVTK